jgi:hypothetical protein
MFEKFCLCVFAAAIDTLDGDEYSTFVHLARYGGGHHAREQV